MTNEPRDTDALVKQLSELKIEVAQGHDGIFTVCSTAEPLFCYDATTIEEVDALVEDTLVSYAKHFFHVDDLQVKARQDPLPEAPLPIEEAKPISRITPVFELAA